MKLFGSIEKLVKALFAKQSSAPTLANDEAALWIKDNTTDYTPAFSKKIGAAAQVNEYLPTAAHDTEFVTSAATTLTLPTTGTLATTTQVAAKTDGPGSSTDEAVARFDLATGKILQNSVVTISDTGAVAGVTTLAASGVVGKGATSGLIIPTGTTAQRSGTENGQIRYNSDTAAVEIYEGGWLDVGGGLVTVPIDHTYATTLAKGYHYLCDMSGAGSDVTLTLPAGAAKSVVRVSVVNNLTGGYKLNVDANGSEKIFYADAQYDDVDFVYEEQWAEFCWDSNDSQWIINDGSTPISGTFAGNLAFTGQILAADGTAAAPGVAFSNEPDCGMYKSGTNEISFSTSGAQRMVVTSGGLFGLGTTPSVALHVSQNTGSDGFAAYLTTPSGSGDDTGLLIGRTGGAGAYIKSTSGQGLQFFYKTSLPSFSDTAAMTLDANGNVSIGTAVPQGKLHVQSTGTSDYNVWLKNGDTDSSGLGNFEWIQCVDKDSDNMGGLRSNSGTPTNIELFNGSDRRIKDVLGPMDCVLSQLLKVELVKYKLKGKEIYGEGVIAQQLYDIFPGLVGTTDDGKGDALPEGMKPWTVGSTWQYILIKAIQEQQALIQAQADAISSLTKGVAKLTEGMAELTERLNQLEKGE